MRTKIKVNSVSSINTKTGSQVIFDIRLLAGSILIGTVFKDENNNKFKILGVGLENKRFNKDAISVLVEVLGSKKIEEFVSHTFIIED